MKFYDKYFACNFEELIRHYPRFYRDVFEMVEILKAHGRIADELEANIEQTYLNNFIDYADEATITKLESFLNLTAKSSLSLEERRDIVKAHFIGFGKISASVLAKIIKSMTSSETEPRIVYEPSDSEKNNALYIEFDCAENASQVLTDIKELFSRKVPAHIPFFLTAIQTSEAMRTTIRPGPAFGAVEYVTILPIIP